MKEILKKKFVLPVTIFAIVGVAGSAYTFAHLGPTTAHAQSPSVQQNTQVGQDKETQDDTVSPKPATTVQQKADTSENDKADSGSSTEVEDGN